MQWNTMSRKEAHDYLLKMNTDSSFYLDNIESLRNPILDEPYRSIHDQLRTVFDQCMLKKQNKEYTTRSWEFGVDLDMAEALYRILKDYGFNPRIASDNEFWIYMSVKVIPDIIILRFDPKKGQSLPHEDRFYENPRRVYPSILWWYFYISLQESQPDPIVYTKRMLLSTGSNSISQLLERPSKEGYPIDLYRHIMAEYSSRSAGVKNADDLLSQVLMLNSVEMETVEPELMFIGLDAYVSILFDEVSHD